MSKADEERARRLADALRENLRRRKAQSRAKDDAVKNGVAEDGDQVASHIPSSRT